MPFFYQKFPFQKIELLSVHIPKTAGMSFLKILEAEYQGSLLKVYKPSLLTKVNEGTLKHIPKRAKALHGHFEVNKHTRRLFPDARIICWLRHPVDRLISHYNYWFTYPPHGNPYHNKFLREKPSLGEFLRDPLYERTIHAYQSFLGELPAEEFFFIGRTEFFSGDLEILASLMKWTSVPAVLPSENIGPKVPLPDNISRDEIEILLKQEIELYHKLIRRFHS